MAKDPAFLFYPGDYLRDTQNFNAEQQVAYDRIMCEHMRNICITQAQLNFFTKRLSGDEKKELLFYLKQVNGGYQIEWVAESIIKRRAFTDSRVKNRAGKHKNICSTYDAHMENENEIEIENVNITNTKKDKFQKPEVAEVAAYCLERQNKINPQAFIDYYISNGWKVGKNPMKDWRAAVRTWEKNNFTGGNNGSGGNRKHGGRELPPSIEESLDAARAKWLANQATASKDKSNP